VTCGIHVGGDVLFMLRFIGEKKISAFLSNYMCVKHIGNPYPLTTPLSVVPSDETKDWRHTAVGREWYEKFYLAPSQFDPNDDDTYATIFDHNDDDNNDDDNDGLTDVVGEVVTIGGVDSDAETVYLGVDEE
jgi:hypothetical protein